MFVTDRLSRNCQMNNFLRIATILLFLLFGAFLLAKPFNVGISYDDGYNASVAKNIAFGIGYKTTYHSEITFNPEITTGPTLLLPAALLIKIFGNTYWVPGLTQVLVILLLLVALFVVIGKKDTRINPFVFFLLFFVGVILFSSVDTTEEQFLDLWVHLVGEIPISLLIIISHIVIRDKSNQKKSTFVSGFVYGLAVITKFISLLAFAGFCCFLIVEFFLLNRRIQPQKIILLFFVVGFSIPPISVFLLKKSLLNDPLVWETTKNYEREFIKKRESGIAQLLNADDKSELIVENAAINFSILKEKYFQNQWPMVLAAGALLCFLVISTLRAIMKEGPSQARLCGLSLIAAALVHASWWVLLSPVGWLRHLNPAILYCLAGAAFLLSEINGVRDKAIAVMLLLFVSYPRLQAFHYLTTINVNKNQDVQALLEVKDYLQGLKGPKTLLYGAGWWANRTLEYVMPQSGNFSDLRKISQETFDSNSIILVRDIRFWEQGKADLQYFQEYCDRNILQVKEPFIVSRCH